MSPPIRRPDDRSLRERSIEPGRPGLSTTTRILILILLFSAIPRAAYLRELVQSPYFTYPVADAAFHHYWARQLVTGAWEAPDGEPDPHLDRVPYLRPPGYPYFLAGIYRLFGCGNLAPRIIQMLLGLGNVLLAFYLGRSCFGSAVGLVFAGLMGGCWVFIYFEGELQPPVLLVSLGLAFMLLALRWASRPTNLCSALVGLGLGLFAIVRPNVLLFVPLLLVWMAWILRRRRHRRRTPSALVLALVGVAAAIAPVTVRNYLVADDFVLVSCNGAVNLYIGNNPTSDGVSANIPELKEWTGSSRWSWMTYPSIVAGLERQEERPMKYSEVSAYFSGKAIDHILSHPLATAALTAKRALLFWGPDEISNNKVIHHDRQASQVLRYLPGFPVALSLGVLGLYILWRDLRASPSPRNGEAGQAAQADVRTEVSAVVLLFVAAYFVSFLPFLAAARFRVPIIPFLLLFGAYGLHRLAVLASEKRYRPAGAWVAGWVVLCALFSVSVVAYEPDLAWWHYERGVAYARNDRLDEAIGEFRRSLERDPTHVMVHYRLASTLAKAQALEASAEHYREALRLNPGMIAAYNNLGAVLARMKRFDEAIAVFNEAIVRDPLDFMVRKNLGIALGDKGSPNSAMEHLRRALQLNPGDADTHLRLGMILEGAGRLEQASHHYKQALKLAPDSTEARARLSAVAEGLQG